MSATPLNIHDLFAKARDCLDAAVISDNPRDLIRIAEMYITLAMNLHEVY